jgi:polysaccharide biosynthesis transport protein
MTRIFEALRKVQVARPAPAPAEAQESAVATAVPPTPVARSLQASVVRLAEARAPGLEIVPAPPLPEDFMVELTHLRYALESALTGKVCRVVAVGSAQPHEGSTTVALALARVLAQDPALRVLLVDAHTKRAGVAGALGLKPEATLRDLLAGRSDVARHVAVVERRNLRVLCARADSQSGAFPIAELREFLAAAASSYDWVILDIAPILETADAAAVAGLADGVVMVLRAGRTKRPVVARAAMVLQKANAHVLGSVLNRRRLEIPEFIYRRI